MNNRTFLLHALDFSFCVLDCSNFKKKEKRLLQEKAASRDPAIYIFPDSEWRPLHRVFLHSPEAVGTFLLLVSRLWGGTAGFIHRHTNRAEKQERTLNDLHGEPGNRDDFPDGCHKGSC